MKIPFLRPSPPRLSEQRRAFEDIENSGIYTNFGPKNARFEAAMVERLFDGRGAGLTVCNATIGLMLAIREALETRANSSARYALVPSFTFAATAHAALWCGLTPILYDIEPETWLPSRSEEIRLLQSYGEEIGVVVPYATFGNCLDLSHYHALGRDHGVPVVVDAAASLGSVAADGKGFGTGSPLPVVYSMHVTKTFSTSEGGFVYADDAERIQRIRSMSNFGFSEPRSAHMPGLNAKLSEMAAVVALAELERFDGVVRQRRELYRRYRSALDGVEFQSHVGGVVSQFVPVLLPDGLPDNGRNGIVKALAAHGVTVGTYFSPHLAEQPYFRDSCKVEPLPVTEQVSRRILSLPIFDSMTEEEVEYVAHALGTCLAAA